MFYAVNSVVGRLLRFGFFSRFRFFPIFHSLSIIFIFVIIEINKSAHETAIGLRSNT